MFRQRAGGASHAAKPRRAAWAADLDWWGGFFCAMQNPYLTGEHLEASMSDLKAMYSTVRKDAFPETMTIILGDEKLVFQKRV